MWGEHVSQSARDGVEFVRQAGQGKVGLAGDVVGRRRSHLLLSRLECGSRSGVDLRGMVDPRRGRHDDRRLEKLDREARDPAIGDRVFVGGVAGADGEEDPIVGVHERARARLAFEGVLQLVTLRHVVVAQHVTVDGERARLAPRVREERRLLTERNLLHHSATAAPAIARRDKEGHPAKAGADQQAPVGHLDALEVVPPAHPRTPVPP